MSLFENFPYTNLHELNIDWLIKELQMVKESAVISVNGETGEVILYQDPDIEFPATDNGGWDMVRKVDGTIAAGIRFTADGVAYLITGAQVKQLYDANHQPPYPVTSVNGQTGEVNLTFPVTSVNNQTGTVILYPEQYVRLPDLTGEQLSSWNFYRYVNSVIHGIQFDNDGRAYIMNGSARYQIYTENNAQPFTFVDNVNAGVMKITQDAPAGVWGFLRETDSGTAGIVFSYESTTPTAYLRYIDAQEVTHNVKLLTPEDIPSSSGVVSINGLTGVVVLTGDSILATSGGSLSVSQVLSNIDSELSTIESDIGIVINGSTASQNVSAGQYVIVKNSTISGITDGLYTSRYNISANTIFTASDLLAVTTGGLNDLLGDVETLNDHIGIQTPSQKGVSITAGGDSNSYATARFVGNICIINYSILSTNALPFLSTLLTFSGFKPVTIINAVCFDENSDSRIHGVRVDNNDNKLILLRASNANCSLCGQIVFAYQLTA